MASSSAAAADAFIPGTRYLVRGLEARSDLNGTIVEILKHKKLSTGRLACRCVSNDDGNTIAIKMENLVAAELEWKKEEVIPTYFADGSLDAPTAALGCSCYSSKKLFVFGGLEETPYDAEEEADDDDENPGESYVGTLHSYDTETKKWTMHWQPGLPSRASDDGMALTHFPRDVRADFSVGPPWKEMASSGILLHWGDVTSGEDLLVFYCSPPIRPSPDIPLHELSFDPSYGEDYVDCVWIFRFPQSGSAWKFGYWVKVPTAGSKPSTYLAGKQQGSWPDRSTRTVRADIFLDDSTQHRSGVKICMWGGMYWPPELDKDNVVQDAQSSIAMCGMFQLHIPETHLGITPASEGRDSPQWLLLPQKGKIQPRVRHNHSLTRVGRDLVVLGGESVDGQPLQEPSNIGTDVGLENYAYNLDSNKWRRLEFTPFGPVQKPLECMSDHLAFSLSKNRILVVRQYDNIHRGELDNLVLLYDLDHMAVHPLSTLSLSHNLRPPKEKKARPLYGLGISFFHCGICIENRTWRLLVHGRASTEEESRNYVSRKYNGALYSTPLSNGMGRPDEDSVNRTPDWCRPGWARAKD
mmetsp:Transcript_17751/g.35439  ORF Transcript_17751/g.35439 Transcript_17751/m.35439 type:complete len:582 (+) Transcript_17751:314-2059(+)|eukprot:CAMPEP_0194320108 /NCGR_PEP_ID=MMETSP0171-20130528/16485_1 /TAXON_ID=218684 /ORGANISM="Corethron pennatum, Strain L29A3" /LENGTH=581 /DNA_ID=CAMNT_0039077563 /DNA_START=468 /DNA_END=2213 /DNA_ORIENTATION=-